MIEQLAISVIDAIRFSPLSPPLKVDVELVFFIFPIFLCFFSFFWSPAALCVSRFCFLVFLFSFSFFFFLVSWTHVFLFPKFHVFSISHR